MKKLDIINFITIIIATVGLALLKVTGITGHIVISLVALAIMVVCTILGKKDWKLPALEILYRLFYLIALVTGIVMYAAELTGAITVVHKVACAVFAVLFIINFIIKLAKK